MTSINCNFAKLLRAGCRGAVAKLPAIKEAARLRYLADPTAYRREKYSCKCDVDGNGLFLISPLCFVHSDPTDLHPEYRNIDPPASWIEEHYRADAMARCFDSPNH
jgi:hypothetical protein